MPSIAQAELKEHMESVHKYQQNLKRMTHLKVSLSVPLLAWDSL